jgi:hypothetical protein
MKCITLAFALFGFAIAPSCILGADRGAPQVKVAVYADGHIVADGHEISLQQLRESFASLSKAHGSVIYFREFPQSEPHPNAMAVVEAIAEAPLPVSFSSKGDFSDVVLPDGTTNPR